MELVEINCSNDGCMISGLVKKQDAEDFNITECPDCSNRTAKFFLRGICRKCVEMFEFVEEETSLIKMRCGFFEGKIINDESTDLVSTTNLCVGFGFRG